MRDIYNECVVPVIPGKSDQLKKNGYLALTILFALGLSVFGLLSGVIALIFSFLFYRQKQKEDSEYEYIHTNDVFDVDLVSGNASRKQLFTTNLERIVLVAPVDAPELNSFRNAKALDFSGNHESSLYVMVCDHNGQKQKLTLCLSKQMLAGLKLWLPGKVITNEI